MLNLTRKTRIWLIILAPASLVFGALCTIGVARHFAVKATPRANGGGLFVVAQDAGDGWDHRFINNHPVYFGAALAFKYPEMRGYQVRRYRAAAVDESDPKFVAMAAKVPTTTIELCGWPCLAFESEEVVPPGTVPHRPGNGGIIVGDHYWIDPLRILSWQPVWSGFLADTLLFSSPLLLPILIFLFLRWRQDMRLRHGFCPRCKYPIGSSPRCPECGEEIALRISN